MQSQREREREREIERERGVCRMELTVAEFYLKLIYGIPSVFLNYKTLTSAANFALSKHYVLLFQKLIICIQVYILLYLCTVMWYIAWPTHFLMSVVTLLLLVLYCATIYIYCATIYFIVHCVTCCFHNGGVRASLAQTCCSTCLIHNQCL